MRAVNSFNGLSKIGQGCMGIGGEFSRNPDLGESHLKALLTGIEAGLTFLDTAEVYADGFSEELVGKAITGRRSEVFVASKFSADHSSYSEVIKAAERSLTRLGTDYLDLYQVHWPNPSVPIAETMGALDELVKDGKILHVGLSNFNGREYVEASKVLSAPIFSNQVELNLFDRFALEDALPACREFDAFLLAYSPLNKGRNTLSGESKRVLEHVANRYSATVHQVQLSWLAGISGVIPIPKSTNLVRIGENARAMDLVLSSADHREITERCIIPKIFVPPSEISVQLKGSGNRLGYQSLTEALENKLGLSPSPSELASSMLTGDPVKPIRLASFEHRDGEAKYELVEGRLRYWAWVIAFGVDSPIPALVNE
jgi:diketogulonate reductase-like aldo/keto reductase